MNFSPRTFIFAMAATLTMSACTAEPQAAPPGSAAGGKLDVAVGFYPYEFITARVGGDDVSVVNLTKPGGEPHDLELTPPQVASLGAADLVVYSRGFQPVVDKAVDQAAADHAFDVLSAAENAGADPHVWLDPVRLGRIATAVAGELGKRRPDRSAGFQSRAAQLTAELTTLDNEMRTGLANCKRREIVTSHAAYGHLAAAYGLEQVALAGLSPEDEPSLGRFADVAVIAKSKGATTIFFEELVSPKVAEQLAREVGAKANVLSPLEGPPQTGDYLSAMRVNLATLRTALDCT